ncbi:MAG: twin-arginine translocation signal domain-containing protein [Alcanivorax sediminis]|uniref:Twin-arginine translocation signal domain-containing protein n=1 Tax=Alcanivorax sediminis TaxID=2663008 RepID=A0A6N7LPI7_9GAMM|nr:twin-arginine translocation signal domain-containing protein [Alcanivorax sediminis]MQX52108.1 twin-arginine translocation signal domain-containing protein [Alcanivorax sediminis]
MDQGINRRGFLKLGTAGAALLATGSGVALLSGCSSNDGPAQGYRHFRQQDVDLLTPLVGAVLGPALAAAGATAADGMKAYDDLLEGAMPGTRDTLFQLLDLMQLGAARWFLTGTWAHFAEQSEEQLLQTLDAWAAKSNSIARMAIKGLTQPMFMAWYVKPAAASTTGYPGPPAKVLA